MVSLLLINKLFKLCTKRGIVISLSLIFSYAAWGQNLVNNPSFEQFNECPSTGSCELSSLPFWEYSKSGDCYLNTCHFSDIQAISCAAPFSPAGDGCFQYPQDGDGYIVLENFIYPNFFYRSQLQTRLIKPLDSLECYYFSMYINLCDSCIVATDDIGVLFVKNSIFLNTPNPVTNFPTPQIFHPGEYIQDKQNWVKYEGTFTAQGGEEFMLIGSFSQPDSIDIIILPTGNQNGNKATYIIDNILLTECDNVAVDEHKPNSKISIYPNPAQDFVSIEMPNGVGQPRLSIYNLTGQLLMQKQITSANQQIPITELSNGMYIFVVQNEDRVIGRQRVVVVR